MVVLRESGRVAKPGAPVVIQAWGGTSCCDLEAMKAVIRPFLPPRPPDAPPMNGRRPTVWSSSAGRSPEARRDACGRCWS
jgi:hypothetical protein